MKLNFRKLNANDISVRVGSKVSEGFSYLLYKDARVDMDLLDEVVGVANWQCDYKEVDGKVYCGVAIKCDNEWIWKWDAGSETHVEEVKGEASDAFKRACFRWGLGRELYNAPFISIKGAALNGLKVKSIEWDGDKIKSLIISDRYGKIVYAHIPQEIVDSIGKCTSTTEVKKIWSDHKELQEFATFKNMILSKGKELSEKGSVA